MAKVMIAEDQRLLRESFRHIIDNNSDLKVVACASNGKEAVEFCPRFNPDIVLMDISMPIMNGIEATKSIKSKYPNIKVLILTSSLEETDVAMAIQNGADGYILKSIGTEELILSIKSALSGLEIIQRDVFKPSALVTTSEETKITKGIDIALDGINVSLTPRELSIIQMVVEGKDNREISEALFIAEGTVKNVITEIISKLQVKDRTQLAVFAIRNKLA